MPHWLLSVQVFAGGVHRPRTQISPFVQVASLVHPIDALTWQTPSRHTFPAGQSESCAHVGTPERVHTPLVQTVPLGQSAFPVHTPGCGVRVVSVGATHSP